MTHVIEVDDARLGLARRMGDPQGAGERDGGLPSLFAARTVRLSSTTHVVEVADARWTLARQAASPKGDEKRRRSPAPGISRRRAMATGLGGKAALAIPIVCFDDPSLQDASAIHIAEVADPRLTLGRLKVAEARDLLKISCIIETC